jgi:type III secretory pathway lipoprotein EscJ
MDRGIQPPTSRITNGVAGLVGYRSDTNALPTVLQHLGHKGHPVHAAVLIQSSQNFPFAAYLHKIAGAKTR